MLKTLNKYILFQLIGPFIFTFVLFTFMLYVDLIFTMIEELIAKGISLFLVTKLLLYALPMSVAVTIPMAFISSILMTFSRLSTNNEIIAMTTNGISILKIISPVLITAFILSCIMAGFNDTILPKANYALKQLRIQILQKHTTFKIKEHVYLEDFKDLVIYVEKVDKKKSLFFNLTLYTLKNRQLEHVIFAQKGSIIADKKNLNLFMHLYKGEIHQKRKQTLENSMIKFNHLYKNLGLKNRESFIQCFTKGPSEMNSIELQAKIREMKKERININTYLVELHKKFSIAFSCLAVALIGLPLGITSSKGGYGIGFGISLMLILIYYILIITGEIIGNKGSFSPAFIMWSPDILLGCIGIYLIKKKNRR